ncbi:family 16 glycosylhydrolase [candidate division KSB1 bacterium]|nr:family 16 glycosylhydrolase [candidate division KSB1 bacterium]
MWQIHPKEELVLKPLNTVIILLVIFVSVHAKPYKGAELRTKEAFTYGRFQVRLKYSPLEGVVSSFFTYHDPIGHWIENWNEIDIEILGLYKDEAQFNTIPRTRQSCL